MRPSYLTGSESQGSSLSLTAYTTIFSPVILSQLAQAAVPRVFHRSVDVPGVLDMVLANMCHNRVHFPSAGKP